jgi:peptidoglycan/xylan/chitin deacetylase (PgdA/CDA1 family)
MSRAGVDMGSHTCTHPILSELSRRDVEHELARSKAAIEAEIGRPVPLLAYPDGCFNDMVRDVARQVGYAYAVQTRRDLTVQRDDRYAVPRTRIEEGHSLGVTGRFSAPRFAFEVGNLSNLLFLRDLRQANPYRLALGAQSRIR